MKKTTKKLLGGLTLALALILGVSTNGANVKARGEAYVPDMSKETVPFDAVRVVGQNEKTREVMNTVNGVVNTAYPNWSMVGGPPAHTALDLAVSQADWSEVSAMRIRLMSHKTPDAPADASGNNIAIGISGLNQAGNNIVQMVTKPNSGKVRFARPDESDIGTLYWINDSIPFFSMGRYMNCYVQIDLSDGLEGAFNYMATNQNKLFTSAGNATTNPIDIENIKNVFIYFEPFNYENICMDFGTVDVKIGNTWTTVFDISKGGLVEKLPTKGWYQTVVGLNPNQAIMDPCQADSFNTDMSCCDVYKVKKTACAEHINSNGDCFCDVCFASVPHWFSNIEDDDENLPCELCGEHICGKGVCYDLDHDGGCDVCNHREYVDQGSPNPPSSSDSSDGKKKSGCGSSMIGVSALTTGALGLALVRLFKKKEND